jgi:hypothetical protein
MRKWLVLAVLVLPVLAIAAQRVMVNEEFTTTNG